MSDYDEKIPERILRKSNLSYDEIQLVEYFRQHPDDQSKIIELLKSNIKRT